MLTEDAVPKLLRKYRKKFGKKKKAIKHKSFGIWNSYTWEEFYESVKKFSLGLISLGFERGDIVLIIGDNEPEWIYASLATQAAGGAFVGGFPDSSALELRYLIKDSEAKFIVVQDQEQIDKLLTIKDEFPWLAKVIYWDNKGLWNYQEPLLMAFGEVLEEGQRYETSHPGLFEQKLEAGRGSDLAMIAYTSGTTGDPKGVMLTQRGLLDMVKSWQSVDPISEGDLLLSFVPLAWAAEHFATINRALYAAAILCFPESPETVQNDLREIGFSTGLISPKLLEQQIGMVETRVSEAGWLQRVTYRILMPIGYKIADLKLGGRKTSLCWKVLYAIANVMLFRPLRDRLGYLKNRVLYTAGAIIAPESYRFYIGIGVNLKCLYGVTEAGGSPTIQRDGDVKPESTGLPAPGCDIRISSDGEIQLRTPGMLIGYYRNEKAYQDLMTPDGWIRTSDSGFIDEDGHLVVLDRMKDMMILQDRTRFSPQYLESKVRVSHFVKEAILFGDNMPFISGLISIDYNTVGQWAEKKGISYTSYADLSQKGEVYELIQLELEKINRTLRREWRVKKYALLVKELDPDDAELTRVRKLRRGFVSETYGPMAKALYDDQPEVEMKVVTSYRDGRTKMESRSIKIRALEEK
jgi:long-chain acyl-CoA synthetase